MGLTLYHINIWDIRHIPAKNPQLYSKIAGCGLGGSNLQNGVAPTYRKKRFTATGRVCLYAFGQLFLRLKSTFGQLDQRFPSMQADYFAKILPIDQLISSE